MNYNPVTKGQISQQAAYDYQRSATGLYEFEVSGGGTKVWADGINGTELVDTKYITNPASSPYTGTAPSFVNQSTIDEIQRYGQVIADPQSSFTSLRIVTNHQAGVDYFSGLLDQFGIPGQVEYRP